MKVEVPYRVRRSSFSGHPATTADDHPATTRYHRRRSSYTSLYTTDSDEDDDSLSSSSRVSLMVAVSTHESDSTGGASLDDLEMNEGSIQAAGSTSGASIDDTKTCPSTSNGEVPPPAGRSDEETQDKLPISSSVVLASRYPGSEFYTPEMWTYSAERDSNTSEEDLQLRNGLEDQVGPDRPRDAEADIPEDVKVMVATSVSDAYVSVSVVPVDDSRRADEERVDCEAETSSSSSSEASELRPLLSGTTSSSSEHENVDFQGTALGFSSREDVADGVQEDNEMKENVELQVIEEQSRSKEQLLIDDQVRVSAETETLEEDQVRVSSMEVQEASSSQNTAAPKIDSNTRESTTKIDPDMKMPDPDSTTGLSSSSDDEDRGATETESPKYELPLNNEAQAAHGHEKSVDPLPIPHSGLLPLSGPLHYSHSGPIPFSGNLSLRSDSSTNSTRSFAFPILHADWNSSPVKMAPADKRFMRRRHAWHRRLFCCFPCAKSFDDCC